MFKVILLFDLNKLLLWIMLRKLIFKSVTKTRTNLIEQLIGAQSLT